MAEELLTRDEAEALFRADVERVGGVVAWARKHGVALGYVSEAYNRKKDAGPALLGRIGAMQVERFLVVRSKAKEAVHG